MVSLCLYPHNQGYLLSMTFFAELAWRNYKNRRRVVVHGLLPVYFQHLLDHLKVLGHRVPGHLSPLGNGAVICLVGVNFHILPDLPLLLGEFLR